MLNNHEKRGVSPLIAAVLLLAFSVALGAVVINFSRTSAEDLTETAGQSIDAVKCNLDISISIPNVRGVPFICYNRSNTGNLEVLVENKAEVDLEGVQLIIFDDDERPYNYHLATALDAHGRTKYDVNLTGTGFVFPPSRLLVSPILTAKTSSYEVCNDVRLDIGDFCKCGEEDCV